MKYSTHIRSSSWAAIRKRKLRAAGWRCERCGHNRATQVHHKHYDTLGGEKMEDLLAVCPLCHMELHPGLFTLDPLEEDYDCPACPSERREVFIGDYSILGICCGCGHETRTRRKKKRAPRVPCLRCGKMVGKGRGLRTHMKVKHPGPTLEELEAPRREAERERIMRLKHRRLHK